MTSANFKSVDEQLGYLKKGVHEIIREEDLRAKLEKSRQTGKSSYLPLWSQAFPHTIWLSARTVIFL